MTTEFERYVEQLEFDNAILKKKNDVLSQGIVEITKLFHSTLAAFNAVDEREVSDTVFANRPAITDGSGFPIWSDEPTSNVSADSEEDEDVEFDIDDDESTSNVSADSEEDEDVEFDIDDDESTSSVSADSEEDEDVEFDIDDDESTSSVSADSEEDEDVEEFELDDEDF